MPLVLPGHEVSLNEPGRRFERHHHLTAYAALVVSGSCHEAGDGGRFDVEAGDVLIHRAFDGHRDCVGRRGAMFINIPVKAPIGCCTGRVSDVDAIVRGFERDAAEGEALFHALFVPTERRASDWPDLLAAMLTTAGESSLRQWAEGHRLHPASVSRGFRLAYGISPKRFRLEARASNAARRVREGCARLADIAAESGFADQAHMTRAFSQLFGISPSALRVLG
jgi:AraC-like DNA-binding protein